MMLKNLQCYLINSKTKKSNTREVEKSIMDYVETIITPTNNENHNKLRLKHFWMFIKLCPAFANTPNLVYLMFRLLH